MLLAMDSVYQALNETIKPDNYGRNGMDDYSRGRFITHRREMRSYSHGPLAYGFKDMYGLLGDLIFPSLNDRLQASLQPVCDNEGLSPATFNVSSSTSGRNYGRVKSITFSI
jgi:hypothetical protein